MLKRNVQHEFSQIPEANIPRSSFNRSHGYKTTFNAGSLIPVYVDEVLPGDTFSLRMSTFARLATPIVPVMDNLYLDSFFFAVPIRLLWSHWEQFNGGQPNGPSESTSYVIPTTSAPGGGYPNGSLADFMGIPTGVAVTHSALFHRAYGLIWNTWFRDENLQNPVSLSTGDGPDAANWLPSPLPRGKRHDYFTSCLPWPQKGPAVTLPLGTAASLGYRVNPFPHNPTGILVLDGNGNPVASQTMVTGASGELKGSGGNTATFNVNDAMFADLSLATAATVNQLRQAFQIQRLYERDARGGTRYIEIVRSHFGVVSPDARLQRPEYLGGGTQMVTVHPVAQTSGTPATGTPQGNLAAFGTSSGSNHGFTKSFTEHCILIGMVSVRADMSYQQGLNKMWSRSGRFDFYWPALANLGEQAVLNQEIYMQGTGADTGVFGYQERFAEYRYKPSQITGQFRSNYSTPLDIWHLAQNFTSLPVLNAAFIQENPPIARCLAVPTAPHFLLDAFFNLRCARPMPTYSVPGMIDHF